MCFLPLLEPAVGAAPQRQNGDALEKTRKKHPRHLVRHLDQIPATCTLLITWLRTLPVPGVIKSSPLHSDFTQNLLTILLHANDLRMLSKLAPSILAAAHHPTTNWSKSLNTCSSPIYETIRQYSSAHEPKNFRSMKPQLSLKFLSVYFNLISMRLNPNHILYSRLKSGTTISNLFVTSQFSKTIIPSGGRRLEVYIRLTQNLEKIMAMTYL